jgi:long-chain acyl-CoA synthetase
MAVPPSVQRLNQTLAHIHPATAPLHLSIVAGPTHPKLLDITLGELLTIQALHYADYECLVFPWTGARWTYAQLKDEADRLARGMLAMGIQKGDRVGVMAGNCEQYISVFFAAARVGAILVVLNNTYTPSELSYALSHSGMIQPNLVFEPCRSLQTIADQELHRSIQVADFSS